MGLLIFIACLAADFGASATDRDWEQASVIVVSQSSSRTTTDVRRVVDKHKGSIYALYARALRNQPSLQGTVTPSIAIAPDGTVTKCNVVSSTLNHSDFERQLVERFRSITFGAKGTTTYINSEYPMSFFSAAASPNKRLQPIVREDAPSG